MIDFFKKPQGNAGELSPTPSLATVLIVDDSPTETTIFRNALIKAGFRVETAVNGEEGVEAAQRLHPDLILMDVIMPGMNGFEATRKLSKDAETRHIPVILCSNKTQETDRVWGLRQGARDYVTKPIDEVELLSKISALG